MILYYHVDNDYLTNLASMSEDINEGKHVLYIMYGWAKKFATHKRKSVNWYSKLVTLKYGVAMKHWDTQFM